MTIAVNQLGQISLPIQDVDTAEAFYGGTLGLRRLYRFGRLTFYDLAGLRLFLDGTREGGRPFAPSASVLYFPDARHSPDAAGARRTGRPVRR